MHSNDRLGQWIYDDDDEYILQSEIITNLIVKSKREEMRSNIMIKRQEMLGRSETRTRERMYCQSIRTV